MGGTGAEIPVTPSVNWIVTALPLDPASSVAKTLTVFRPFVVNSPALTLIEKFPKMSVQLAAMLVPANCWDQIRR